VNEALLCGTPVVCSKYAGCAADLLDPDDIFDPLIPEEIDRALIRAISGKATPPNIDRIWPMSRVVEAIVTDVQQILGP